MQKLTACLDANVYISGIAFGGKPLEILERAFNRDFLLVTGPNILQEVRRNLLNKLQIRPSRIDLFIADISDNSSIFVPSGQITFIGHKADNLVLELALMSGCDVLVTGDKKHLLPLKKFQGIIIEPPSHFLRRLDAQK